MEQKRHKLTNLCYSEVLGFDPHAPGDGFQHLSCAGVLLAHAHQKLEETQKKQELFAPFPTKGRSSGKPTETDWSHLDGLLMRFLSKEENGENLLLLRKGNRQVQEGVKGDGNLKKQAECQTR